MSFWGFDCKKTEIAMDYMPRQSVYFEEEEDCFYGPDPRYIFAGDPSQEQLSFGCYSPCLVETFKRYCDENQYDDYIAIDLTGKSLDDLLQQYVANDIPVLTIVTPNLVVPKYGATWVMPDGQKWHWEKGHHAMVIRGFSMESNMIYVTDSACPSGMATYPLEDFRRIYDLKGKSAMTILES